jgi:predicted regulator of Ras-like GTPase activity (Roadblock/LC7/MglB family)
MDKVFDDILALNDVKGVLIVSLDGKILSEKFSDHSKEGVISNAAWFKGFFKSLKGIAEADLVFENNRIYIKSNRLGYIMVLMGRLAQPSMVRLNCDLIVSGKKGKKLWKRFKWI